MSLYPVLTTVLVPGSGPVAGATVTVYDADGTLATIYADAGGASVIAGSVLTTNASGQATYYAAPGDYLERFTKDGYTAGAQDAHPGVWVGEERRYELAYPVEYWGIAPTGAAEAAAVWTITRLTYAGGAVTEATASGVAWTNRTTATYT